MKHGLDTSVVLRLLTGDPPAQAQLAAEWVARCRASGHPATVSDLVMAESYFALQTHYRVPKREALAALRELLESGDVAPAGQALQVLRSSHSLASAKPGFVERLIHAAIRGSGARMLTFERSARRLPQTTVLDNGR
jgi:predicted nucleic acid-binding protein